MRVIVIIANANIFLLIASFSSKTINNKYILLIFKKILLYGTQLVQSSSFALYRFAYKLPIQVSHNHLNIFQISSCYTFFWAELKIELYYKHICILGIIYKVRGWFCDSCGMVIRLILALRGEILLFIIKEMIN